MPYLRLLGLFELNYYLSKIFYWPFQGGTSFVDLLCFCSVLCLLCLCARLFICALWSPAGKGLTSWLSFVVSTVSLSLSHWYPGSGVVFDCIDFWSLHPYLLWCSTSQSTFSVMSGHFVQSTKDKTLYDSCSLSFLKWLKEFLNTSPTLILSRNIEDTRWVSLDIKFTRQGFENACWHREACPDIENTGRVSFDIKFTRQGFENSCWLREACRAIQHAFLRTLVDIARLTERFNMRS